MSRLIFTHLSSTCFVMKNHLIGVLLFTPGLTISSRDACSVFLDEILVFQRSIRHIARNHTCVKTITVDQFFLELSSHDSIPYKFPENLGRIICKQHLNKEEYTGLMTRGNKKSIL